MLNFWLGLFPLPPGIDSASLGLRRLSWEWEWGGKAVPRHLCWVGSRNAAMVCVCTHESQLLPQGWIWGCSSPSCPLFAPPSPLPSPPLTLHLGAINWAWHPEHFGCWCWGIHPSRASEWRVACSHPRSKAETEWHGHTRLSSLAAQLISNRPSGALPQLPCGGAGIQARVLLGRQQLYDVVPSDGSAQPLLQAPVWAWSAVPASARARTGSAGHVSKGPDGFAGYIGPEFMPLSENDKCESKNVALKEGPRLRGTDYNVRDQKRYFFYPAVRF